MRLTGASDAWYIRTIKRLLSGGNNGTTFQSAPQSREDKLRRLTERRVK